MKMNRKHYTALALVLGMTASVQSASIAKMAKMFSGTAKELVKNGGTVKNEIMKRSLEDGEALLLNLSRDASAQKITIENVSDKIMEKQNKIKDMQEQLSRLKNAPKNANVGSSMNSLNKQINGLKTAISDHETHLDRLKKPQTLLKEAEEALVEKRAQAEIKKEASEEAVHNQILADDESVHHKIKDTLNELKLDIKNMANTNQIQLKNLQSEVAKSEVAKPASSLQLSKDLPKQEVIEASTNLHPVSVESGISDTVSSSSRSVGRNSPKNLLDEMDDSFNNLLTKSKSMRSSSRSTLGEGGQDIMPKSPLTQAKEIAKLPKSPLTQAKEIAKKGWKNTKDFVDKNPRKTGAIGALGVGTLIYSATK